ncbi:MAG: Holliday junction resolvase RecU [Bacillaceae bacterium]|nr:Holliday junction resolvase RecU [Bacillaceae bacterium]
MKYPNGKKKRFTNQHTGSPSYGNRGMTLENDINQTNLYYLETGKAVIHKKPTPVQIVTVDYPKRSAAVIREAYFKQPSTTDYNGIYKGKYIDFEAKETKGTSLPFSNIHEHQIQHMKAVVEHGGICFLLVRFSAKDETYLLPAKSLFAAWDNQFHGGRKSLPYSYVAESGHPIPFSFHARVDYLSVVNKLYF